MEPQLIIKNIKMRLRVTWDYLSYACLYSQVRDIVVRESSVDKQLGK